MQQYFYSHDITVRLDSNAKQERDFGLTPGWEICPPLPLTEELAQLLQTLRELDDIPQVFEGQTTEEAAQPSSEEQNPIFEFGSDPSTPPTMPTFDDESQNNNVKAQETYQTAEALETPQENSFIAAQPIETTTEYQPEQQPAQGQAMDTSSISADDYLAPTPGNKPFLAPKVECSESENPTVIKRKRVTIEDSFKNVLAYQQQDGWYWIPKAQANEIATIVLAGQVKISRAGHPNKGKTGPRTPYSKLHDAMHKAKWIREDFGEYYRYSQKL